jgi:hypothetical protein
MQAITIKRGDTFEAVCTVPLAFGQTISSTACQCRKNGALVQDFTVTIGTPTATDYVYTISASATQTAPWSLGDMRADIQYTIGQKVASTETFTITVLEDITR